MQIKSQLAGFNYTEPALTTEPVNASKARENQMYIRMYFNYNNDHYKPGYFTVGTELISRLYHHLQSYGYTIPDRDDKSNHRIRPDKAVQPAFDQYLDMNDVPLHSGACIADKFGCVDPDDRARGFDVKHYRLDLYQHFITFLNGWLANDAGEYLKIRDKSVGDFPHLFQNQVPKKNSSKKKIDAMALKAIRDHQENKLKAA